MALDWLGSITSRNIDRAASLTHDLILNDPTFKTGEFNPDILNGELKVGETGIWRVFASMLDGKPAIEIRICVG